PDSRDEALQLAAFLFRRVELCLRGNEGLVQLRRLLGQRLVLPLEGGVSAIERQCETEPEGDRPQSDEPSHEPAPRAFLLDEGVFVELQVGKVFHVGLTFALACVQGNTEAWRALLRRRERSRTA